MVSVYLDGAKALPPTRRPENTAAERRHNCF